MNDKKDRKENRSELVHIRLTPAEKRKLMSLAKVSGRFEYLSSFIRKVVLTEAEKGVLVRNT